MLPARLTLPPEGPREVSANFQGIPIIIEWLKGDTRKGIDKNGNSWENKMRVAYGYIADVYAHDTEEMDIYVGPNDDSDTAYAVEQLGDNGETDEYKIMLGFDSEEDAIDAYLDHYPRGWEDHIGAVLPIKMNELKAIITGLKGITV